MQNNMVIMKLCSRGAAAVLGTLLAAGAMSSCSDSGRDYSDSEVIRIEKEALKTVESYDLYDTYKSVEIIPLETTSESLFAGVEQAVVNGDDIYVLAEMSKLSLDAKVMQFKKDGSFVRQIGTIGEGPGEYLSIAQIVLANDTLFAFDEYNSCVHAYEAATGRYLTSSPQEKFDAMIAMSSVIKNPLRNNFLFTGKVIFGDDRFSLAEGNPMTGEFNILMPPRFSVDGWISFNYGTTTICDLDGRNAVAILPLDNTVYRVDYATGEATPFCELITEKKMPEFKPMENYEVARKASQEAQILWPTAIFATKDYLIVNRVLGSVVWNIGTSEGYFTPNGWKEDGMTEFPFLPSNIVGTLAKTNTFICEYEAENFMDYYKAMPEKRPYKVTAHNISQVTDDSNPVLVLYTLK